MVRRSKHLSALALALALFSIIGGVPFAAAGTVAASPLGTITAGGSVTVGNTAAPTGTTIFAGDKVSSVNPALIKLETGSRIEMTKAAALFSRQGKTIVVTADKGLLRFNFKKGESVQIKAGKFQLNGGNDSALIGELGLDGKGQLAMTMTEGRFEALNTETGARVEVSPAKSLSVTATGKAQVPAAAAGAGVATATTTFSVIPAVVAGVGAGVMSGVAIHETLKDQSPSSR
jgi:hypothetical protein